MVIGTSLIAAIHGGRLLSASICVFSMKMVSLRIQLFERTVRSSIAALPTLLKSGWVLVASGVFVQWRSCVSSIRSMVACGDGVAREEIAFERPAVALAPEAVHHRVHIFDVGAAVVAVGEQRV